MDGRVFIFRILGAMHIIGLDDSTPFLTEYMSPKKSDYEEEGSFVAFVVRRLSW